MKNGGLIVRNACSFSDSADAIDAHHLQPLAAGIRTSQVDDLVVFYPICHRWAHAKADDKLSAIPIMEIMKAMQGGTVRVA